MSKEKTRLLGMPYGTATNRLRKAVLFRLLVEHQQNTCYRCGAAIDSVDDLSMEHKEPWQGASDPKATFFDLENIAFSHLSCNVGAPRREKTHCPQGHPYDEENTRVVDGGRFCRKCNAVQSLAAWYRNDGAGARQARRRKKREAIPGSSMGRAPGC